MSGFLDYCLVDRILPAIQSKVKGGYYEPQI